MPRAEQKSATRRAKISVEHTSSTSTKGKSRKKNSSNDERNYSATDSNDDYTGELFLELKHTASTTTKGKSHKKKPVVMKEMIILLLIQMTTTQANLYLELNKRVLKSQLKNIIKDN